MRAKVTGKSMWQGEPTTGTLDIEITGRYVDSSGNATVSHYTGVLNDAKTGFKDARTGQDLYIVVQGPDDPAGPRATFREVLGYADGKEVRTTFARKLISTDLAGLFFDYAAPDPGAVPGFGDAPLSMQAAAAVIAQSALVNQALADLTQTTAGLQSAAAGAVPYVNLAAFPAANLYNGKAAWATDTGFVYKSNGASWVKTGEVPTTAAVQAATAAAAEALSQLVTQQGVSERLVSSGVAALAAAAGRIDGDVKHIRGVSYVWDATSTETADGYAVVSAGGTGRWTVANRERGIPLRVFGAVPDCTFTTGTGATISGTDNTAALQRAADYVSASGRNHLLLAELGKYRIDGTVNCPVGFSIAGVGHGGIGSNPRCAFVTLGSNTMFQWRTFNAAENFYQGNWNATFRDVAFINPAGVTTYTGHGTRTGIGIQDNGGGAVTLQNVLFSGLKYGYAAPYGADFNRFSNISAYRCDLGIYMGPGSDQWVMSAYDTYGCQRGLTMEYTQNISLTGLQFVGTVRPIEIPAPSVTEFGRGMTGYGYRANGPVVMRDVWFEDNAGDASMISPTNCLTIGTTGGSTGTPKRITLEHVVYIGGSGGGTPNSLVKLLSGQHIRIRNVNMVTNDMTWIVDNAGVDASIIVDGISTPDGYTLPSIFSTPTINSVILDPFGVRSGSTAPEFRVSQYANTANYASLGYINGGGLTLITAKSGSANYTLNVFAENRYLILRDRTLGWRSAPPTTGTYQPGDVFLNSAGGDGAPVGWRCISTSAATPGVWSVIGQAGARTTTAAPTLNAVFVGEELLDTTNKKWYKAVSVGSGATDWVALN